MQADNNSIHARYSPLWQLTLARIREFYRVPEAIFWVYGFPLLMALALGIAFRGAPVEEIAVDVLHSSDMTDARIEALKTTLTKDERFKVEILDEAEARRRLQRGKTDLILVPVAEGRKRLEYEYVYEPNRPASALARSAVDAVLARASAGDQAPAVRDEIVTAPGSRYIDFLIPGLLGMGLMSGGLWGVGFVTVDMRVRKLLKRFLATPMRKHHFLLSLMLSRLLFTIPEVLILLLFGWLVFGVGIQGNPLLLVGVIVLGGASFCGVGLLVACRAKTVETVSGLMNLVMLPMFILSGVFFTSERFPAVVQPFIQALPLTALNDALRGVMLDGAGVASIGLELAILAAWGAVSFVLALRWFRWG